jgi:hypothetical protein
MVAALLHAARKAACKAAITLLLLALLKGVLTEGVVLISLCW